MKWAAAVPVHGLPGGQAHVRTICVRSEFPRPPRNASECAACGTIKRSKLTWKLGSTRNISQRGLSVCNVCKTRTRYRLIPARICPPSAKRAARFWSQSQAALLRA